MISPEIRINEIKMILKKIICIDGKRCVLVDHIVSARVRKMDFVWDRKQSKKSNEITAIPDLKGQIITIDAMGTQTLIERSGRSQEKSGRNERIMFH